MILKVLIGCEESQEVCKAFRELGHEAYSCDILDCSGGHPEWHLKWDVMEIIYDRFPKDWITFDVMIAFPPCTNLSVSGARWFKTKKNTGEQQNSIDFFMKIVNAPIKHIAIENPIGIMSTQYRKPDQIIQPWQFGHGETKATCLWLKNLPKLELTNIVEGREQKIWKMPPSKDRAKLRSKTYSGIATAMAEQWSEYILNQNI